MNHHDDDDAPAATVPVGGSDIDEQDSVDAWWRRSLECYGCIVVVVVVVALVHGFATRPLGGGETMVVV